VAEGIIVGVTVAEGTTVCEGSTGAGEGAGVHADRQSASITKASTDLLILLFTHQSLRLQHSKNPLVCQLASILIPAAPGIEIPGLERHKAHLRGLGMKSMAQTPCRKGGVNRTVKRHTRMVK